MRSAVKRRVLLCAGAGVVTVVTVVTVVGPARAVAAEPAWTWPLVPSATVTRAFDPPAHRYASGHRGADLAGSPGAPVVAAGAGQVTYAGLLAGRGVVVVSHGDLRTTYEPVSASVAVGQAVVAGQALGALDAGHAGCPVSACLHWGLRRGDTYLDPVQLVDPGPVRLLPVGPAEAGGAQAPTGALPVQRSSADRGTQRPAPTAPPATATEPDWSLRAAEAPLGAAAVAALAAGLALLARPRRPPSGPAGSAAAAVPTADSSAGPVEAVPVDLGAERLRRRVG